MTSFLGKGLVWIVSYLMPKVKGALPKEDAQSNAGLWPCMQVVIYFTVIPSMMMLNRGAEIMLPSAKAPSTMISVESYTQSPLVSMQ